MQVQKKADIMTAKANAVERKQVIHHYLDQYEVNEEDDRISRNKSNVSKFVSDCDRIVNQIQNDSSTPFIVGGSMNYFERQLISDTLINAQQDDLSNTDAENEVDRGFINKYKDYTVSDL